MLKISEQDLFNYFFHKEIVNPEKIEMIENQKELHPSVNFYRELYDILNEDIPESIKNRIAEKISAYKPTKIIHLSSVKKDSSNQMQERIFLAAASESYSSRSVYSTFLDEGKNVLIRVIDNVNEKLIYVFSTNKALLKDFKVILHPSNQVFSSDDNTKPIRVDSKTDIQSITVELL